MAGPTLPPFFLLSLQFPVGRAPGFSRIEGSALVRLKPLVRQERANRFNPPVSPRAATAGLLSIHLCGRRLFYRAMSVGPLGPTAHYRCMYSRSCDWLVPQRNSDCKLDCSADFRVYRMKSANPGIHLANFFSFPFSFSTVFRCPHDLFAIAIFLETSFANDG